MDVYKLRERLGMNQEEFAAFVGTRQATISDWETGTKRPSPMAQRLLTLLVEKLDREPPKRASATGTTKKQAPKPSPKKRGAR